MREQNPSPLPPPPPALLSELKYPRRTNTDSEICVVYRQREHAQKAYPFPERDESAHYSEVYRLVTFHRCFAKTLGYFYDSFLQETRDIKAPEDQKPVGLALASNGIACVVWRSPDRLNGTKMFIVGRNKITMVCDLIIILFRWHRQLDRKISSAKKVSIFAMTCIRFATLIATR